MWSKESSTKVSSEGCDIVMLVIIQQICVYFWLSEVPGTLTNVWRHGVSSLSLRTGSDAKFEDKINAISQYDFKQLTAAVSG